MLIKIYICLTIIVIQTHLRIGITHCYAYFQDGVSLFSFEGVHSNFQTLKLAKIIIIIWI